MSLQNLFVAKLPRNITDSDLQQIFAEFHPSSAKIMLDAATGKSKGFGFVLFDAEENGAKAYKALNRKMTHACGHNFTLVIYPSNYDGKIFAEETNALYIRNIPMSVGQDRVERFLRTFGNLTYFAVREDHYGSPVWVIYAEYETVEEAKSALTKLHGNNTYFHGSAPILAKFEDSDDAKRERRRRREVTQAHVLSSNCVFPPPRDHHDDSCSSFPANASSTFGNEVGHTVRTGHLGHEASAVANGTGNHNNANGGSTPRLLSPPSASHALPDHMLSPSLPSYGSSMAEAPHVTPPMTYSMPQHLLQPTPGYCYTLAESGQQIFIPASFTPAVPSFDYMTAVPQSAPTVLPPPVVTMPPTPPASTTTANHVNNTSLLNPEANRAMVLTEGGQQFVLSPDTINLKPEKLAAAAHVMKVPLLHGSQSKSLSGGAGHSVSFPAAESNDALFGGPLPNLPHSFYPSSLATSTMPNFMVTQTSRSMGSAPMMLASYNSA